MTDLHHVLPDFPTKPFSHLLPSLDKHYITVSDLIALDAVDIAKRAQLPAGEVRKLADAVLEQLHRQLGVNGQSGSDADHAAVEPRVPASVLASDTEWHAISTLDDALDEALGGGVPKG